MWNGTSVVRATQPVVGEGLGFLGWGEHPAFRGAQLGAHGWLSGGKKPHFLKEAVSYAI